MAKRKSKRRSRKGSKRRSKGQLSTGQKVALGSGAVALAAGAAELAKRVSEKKETERLANLVPDEFKNMFPLSDSEEDSFSEQDQPVENIPELEPEPEPVSKPKLVHPEQPVFSKVHKGNQIINEIIQEKGLGPEEVSILQIQASLLMDEITDRLSEEDINQVLPRCTESEKVYIQKILQDDTGKPLYYNPLNGQWKCFNQFDRPLFVKRFKERIVMDYPEFENEFKSELLSRIESEIKRAERRKRMEEIEQKRVQRQEERVEREKRGVGLAQLTDKSNQRFIQAKKEKFEKEGNENKLQQLKYHSDSIEQLKQEVKEAREQGDYQQLAESEELLRQYNAAVRMI